MSAEPAAAIVLDPTIRFRRALRMALAVSVGLCVELLSGSALPFLAPLFAMQLLAADTRPMKPRAAIGLVAVIAVSAAAMIGLCGALTENPVLLLTMLGLVYFICFFVQAQGKGGGAVFFVVVVAVMVPILQLVHDALDASLMVSLVRGVAGGILLSWLAHLVVPPRNEEAVAPPALPAIAAPGARALASAVILLGAVALCLLNRHFNTATELAITVASLLLLPSLSGGIKASIGLLLLNLAGGLLASFCAGIAVAADSLIGIFLLTLLVGLGFAWRIAAGDAVGKLCAGALTTFLILFGIGLSPLPADTGDSFTTRLSFVAIAVVYTLCLTVLLWRRETEPPMQRAAVSRSTARAIPPPAPPRQRSSRS